MYLCVSEGCEFELDWLTHLLPEDTLYITREEKKTKYQDIPCIFIVSYWCGFREENNLDNIKHNFGIIYLSEEILSDRLEFLFENDFCKFIWRNYVHPHHVFNTKVTHFPCAYKSGFTQYIKNTDKKYTWSFAGAIHGEDRALPLHIFSLNFDNYKIHPTPANTFDSEEGLSTENYVKLMQESKYILCPPGKIIIECSRLYEALEAGAIPIVLSNTPKHLIYNPSYYYYVFPKILGDFPFIMVNNWEEAISIINDIEENNEYEQKLNSCKIYWKNCKIYWKDLIKSHLSLL